MLVGKIIFLNSWCKFAGGYQIVPGEIRGRLLKIFYVARTKKHHSPLREVVVYLLTKINYFFHQFFTPLPIKPNISMNKSIIKKDDTNAQIVSNGFLFLSVYNKLIPAPIKNAFIYSLFIT